jgi:hypothetical protein
MSSKNAAQLDLLKASSIPQYPHNKAVLDRPDTDAAGLSELDPDWGLTALKTAAICVFVAIGGFQVGLVRPTM